MKTLTLFLLLTIGSFAVPAQDDLKASRAVRLALYGQNIRFPGGGWIFQKDEIIEVDVISADLQNDRMIAVAEIRSADAPGRLTTTNGAMFVTEVTGRLRVTIYRNGQRVVENISLSSRRIPVQYVVPQAGVTVPVPNRQIYTPSTPTRTLLNQDVTIGAGNFTWQPFDVTYGGTVFGRLEGSGGNRGEFESYIVDDRQLTDFRNGRQTPTFWSSGGSLVVHEISANLSPGRYYVLLRNPGGWVSRKVRAVIMQ